MKNLTPAINVQNGALAAPAVKLSVDPGERMGWRESILQTEFKKKDVAAL